MHRKMIVLLVCLFYGWGLTAEEAVDTEVNWKIRREAAENSQIMNIIQQLADIHGPRLTGSPAFYEACRWSLETMKQWGLENGHLENWDFPYAGWGEGKFYARVIAPYMQNIYGMAVAWTPGTRGMKRADAVRIDPPERPTHESLQTYLRGIKDRVRGKIVLTGAPAALPISFNPPVKRHDESELLARYDPENSEIAPAPPEPNPGNEASLAPHEVFMRINAFLRENGALAKVVDSARSHGQLSALVNPAYDAANSVPVMVIRNEDYGRISRVLARGKTVTMELEIENTVFHSNWVSFNAIADIPGSDRQDQIVMIGAHIDSWHGATGATDNAAGVAVIMEAARILRKLDVRPQKTIRVALWGGEEQGLLGSKAHVQNNFGAYERRKPGFGKLSAYINLDAGTGRIRGASVFGPPEAAAVVRRILGPFRDMGVVGVTAVRNRRHGNTDSTSFSSAGLPGITLEQDPIEYFTHTWHTSLDTYERISEEDLKQCAIVVASLAWHLATRDELLPRFTENDMPPPEK
ncbi:MAG TPA: M20/M25/M40 family metallo-hydrolase [Acidobacteriota bacterium]|nr:M20/M25/M40 family metallo-hydrolase [Acidobacteriota bacterium]